LCPLNSRPNFYLTLLDCASAEVDRFIGSSYGPYLNQLHRILLSLCALNNIYSHYVRFENMAHPVSQDCTTITANCLVENTIYGYYPSLGLNIFFIIFFGICSIVNLYVGLRSKMYFYGYALVLGCLGEVTGYIGRVIMHGNPVCYPLTSPLFECIGPES